MRVAELILVQPDGAVKRLVVKSEDADIGVEKAESNDQSMITSLCQAMMDQDFRSNLSEVEDEGKRQLKAIWQT